MGSRGDCERMTPLRGVVYVRTRFARVLDAHSAPNGECRFFARTVRCSACVRLIFRHFLACAHTCWRISIYRAFHCTAMRCDTGGDTALATARLPLPPPTYMPPTYSTLHRAVPSHCERIPFAAYHCIRVTPLPMRRAYCRNRAYASRLAHCAGACCLTLPLHRHFTLPANCLMPTDGLILVVYDYLNAICRLPSFTAAPCLCAFGRALRRWLVTWTFILRPRRIRLRFARNASADLFCRSFLTPLQFAGLFLPWCLNMVQLWTKYAACVL